MMKEKFSKATLNHGQAHGDHSDDAEREHHSEDEVDEEHYRQAEQHTDEDGGESSETEDIQCSDSERREMRVPELPPAISSRAGPHGMNITRQYFISDIK